MFTTSLNTSNTANMTLGTRRNGRSGLARRRGRDRGLVLILVVALCATLAILGTTFLFISRTDRRRTSAIEYRQRASLAAQGIVAEVRALLKADLHLGADYPYQDLNSEPRRFFDYPGEEGGASPTTDADLYLATFEPDSSNNWLHLTNLTGSADTDYVGVAKTDTDLQNISGQVDGSGDPLREAMLFSNGSLYAAVRVIDLGGLMNVNTGYTCGSMTTPPAPVCVGLKEYLEAAGITWDLFNAERCADTEQLNIGLYYTELASRLYNPGTNSSAPGSPKPKYEPYAVSDEAYLRWLGTNGEAISGRLYNKADLSTVERKYLTTFNISRNVLREPLDDDVSSTAGDIASELKRVILNPSNITTDEAIRTDLFERLVSSGICDTADKAGHLVANLWAFLDGSSPAKAYEFQGTGMTITAFGVVPQPFITEAYAKVTANTLVAPDDDSVWGYAIEVFNPSSSPLAIVIGKPDGTVTNTTVIPIPANDKKVIYSFGKGAQSTVNNYDFFNKTSGDFGNWIEHTGVNFTSGGEVAIIRQAKKADNSDVYIVLDSIAAGDLSFTGNTETNITNPESADLRRDDSTTRCRYSVADCNVAVHTTDESTTHALGAANNVSDTDIPLTTCHAGFFIPKRDALAAMESLGSMMTLYLTGPDSNHKTLPVQLNTYKADATRGAASIAAGTTAASPYPTVPLTVLVGELFDNLSADANDADAPGGSTGRYYGRVNVNTAPQTVLEYLPWPTTGSIAVGATTITFDSNTPQTMAKLLIDYRDEKDGTAESRPNYSSRGTKGFRTPGEVVIPLADYIYYKNHSKKLSDADANEKTQADYQETQAIARYLYGYVSSLISVQSDVYAVYIRLQVGDDDDPEEQWRYLAIIDRSNCKTSSDEPALLLFTPLK